MGWNIKKLNMSWNVGNLQYFTIIHCLIIFLCETCFHFNKPYYMTFTYFVRSIYLWKHPKYMTVSLISFFTIIMSVCFIEHTKHLCESSLQKSSLKVLTMPSQQVIYKIRDLKNTRMSFIVTSRGIYFPTSLNITTPITRYSVGSQKK